MRRVARPRDARPGAVRAALAAAGRGGARRWEGLGEAEIAQLLGFSARTVRAHARRGLAALRAHPSLGPVVTPSATVPLADTRLRSPHMKRHRKFPRPTAESERLREVFAEAAHDVTPSAVPLAAIERAGRRRGRRRTAAVAGSACALLVVPLAVVALRSAVSPGSGDEQGDVPPRYAHGHGAALSRRRTGRGRARHQDLAHRGRRALVHSRRLRPAVQQCEGRRRRPRRRPSSRGRRSWGYFLSGVYRGKREAARVVIETTAGQVRARQLASPRRSRAGGSGTRW